MGSNGQWNVKCNKPIKVVFDNTFLDVPILTKVGEASLSGHVKSFSGFTLFSENGIKYIFGGDNTSIEYSIGFFNQFQDEWIANSWHLRKIIYPDGREINFSFIRGSYICQMYQYFVRRDYYVATIDAGGLNRFLSVPCNQVVENSNPLFPDKTYTGKLIYPVYLSKIKSNDFEITLYSSPTTELQFDFKKIIQPKLPADSVYYLCQLYPYLFLDNNGVCKTNEWSGFNTLLQWKKLDSIVVMNNYNNRINTTAFVYNNNTNQRCFLESIKVNQGNYGFAYNNRDLLPKYLENKVDHWGFFNNMYAGYSDENLYYNLRQANSIGNVQKYGILEKITFPAGGSTQFVFEPNRYSKQLKLNRWEGCEMLQENAIAGGLRIKKIINDPGDGSANETKEYYYTKNFSLTDQVGLSSGVLGGQTKYSYNDTIVWKTNGVTQGVLLQAFTSNSVMPACNNKGNHIGYSEVVEKYSNGGYIRYVYSNFDNGYLDEKPENSIQQRLFYSPFNSREEDRGNLISKEVFDSSGKRIQKEIFEYEKHLSNSFVKNINFTADVFCSTYRLVTCTAYKTYTYSNLLKNTKNVSYLLNDSVIKEFSYTYDPNYPIIISEETMNSQGNKLKTLYTYPFNLYFNYLPNSTTQITSSKLVDMTSTLYSTCINMTSSNFLGKPIEITKYLNNDVIESKLIVYGKHGNDFLPDSILTLGTTNPISGFLRFGTPYFGAYRDYRYELNPLSSYKYDSRSNIIQFIKGGYTTSYLWSYSASYPVAKIEGLSYSEVSDILNPGLISYISTSYVPDNNGILAGLYTNSTLQAKKPLISTYTYRPMVGILTSTDSRGLTTTYTYDTYNRLISIIGPDGKILEKIDYHFAQ